MLRGMKCRGVAGEWKRAAAFGARGLLQLGRVGIMGATAALRAKEGGMHVVWRHGRRDARSGGR